MCGRQLSSSVGVGRCRTAHRRPGEGLYAEGLAPLREEERGLRYYHGEMVRAGAADWRPVLASAPTHPFGGNGSSPYVYSFSMVPSALWMVSMLG